MSTIKPDRLVRRALHLYQADDEAGWEARGDMRDGRQVVALHHSDHSPAGPLLDSLCLWARMAATRVAPLADGR